MADKTIGALPQAEALNDESMYVVEDSGVAKYITGAQLKEYAKKAADESAAAAKKYADSAQESLNTMGSTIKQATDNAVAESTKAAKDAASVAQTARNEASQSAHNAEVSQNAAATSAADADKAQSAIENMIVEAVTLATGKPASVSKSLVDGVVKLVFGLPTGAKGDKGEQGTSIESITKTSGTGQAGSTDTYTITLTDGSTSTFNVYNGRDGSGAGDMLASVYDPDGKAQNIFVYVDNSIATHNKASDAHADIRKTISDHIGNTSNPHKVTASQVGALPLTGGTLTGNLTGKYISGTWLQATASTDLNAASSKVAVFDASGWLYYRTVEEMLSDIGAAPSTHASQHATDGSDPITPASIGAAPTSHNHNSSYYKKAEVNTTPKPNLFINPLFQVWQLYPSGWSGVPVNRYICDGWRVLSSDGSKSNNFTPASPCGITSAAGGANCTVTQFLENAAQFNGLKMTCSVLKILANGSQSFVTATKTASGWTDTTDILAFFGTASTWRWVDAGETFVGAKLEVGTRQTFAYKQTDGTYTLNNIPPVAEQLAICNKYDPETGKLLGGWEHPPMQLGVEYRTTERYLGKPVYCIAINFGSLPNATSKAISYSSTADNIVRAYGKTSNGYLLPGINLAKSRNLINFSVSAGWITVLTSDDQSAYTATMCVFFTKTTD